MTENFEMLRRQLTELQLSQNAHFDNLESMMNKIMIFNVSNKNKDDKRIGLCKAIKDGHFCCGNAGHLGTHAFPAETMSTDHALTIF